MTDILQAAETTAKADLTAAEAYVAPAVSDIKALVANRAGDVLVATIVLLAVYIGHTL